MIVPVDGMSGSVSVLDGPGGRSTGDGVFPRGRSGWAPQAVLNVHTLEIAKGSDYCSHLLGLEPACNLSSECSTTMTTTSYDSESSDDNSYYDAREPLEELHLIFTGLPPWTRLIPGGRGYDNEVWISFGPQYDKDWNQWMVAYNDYEIDEDQWVVRRIVWWWGEYTDSHEKYTDWFVGPELSMWLAR